MPIPSIKYFQPFFVLITYVELLWNIVTSANIVQKTISLKMSFADRSRCYNNPQRYRELFSGNLNIAKTRLKQSVNTGSTRPNDDDFLSGMVRGLLVFSRMEDLALELFLFRPQFR